jgi:hypothetical protein
MEETKELSTVTAPTTVPAVTAPSVTDFMFEPTLLDRLNRMADVMATARGMVPPHFHGKPGDCLGILLQSLQWRMNPYAVAQKTYIPVQGGQIGYEAQLIASVVINRGPIVGRPVYEFFGDWSKILGRIKEETGRSGGKFYKAAWDEQKDEEGIGVVCRCTLHGESDPRELKLLLKQCWPRFSTQWATDPQQQICYAALRKWARRYTPDVLLGIYSPDELLEMQRMRDIGDAERSAPSRIEQAAGIATPATGAAKEEISQHPDAAILNEVIDLVRKGELQAAKELGKTLTTNAARTTARNMIRAAQEQKKASSNGDQGSSDTRKWTLDELKRVIKDADPKDHGRYLLEARRELSDQEYEDLIGFVDDLRGPGGPSGDDEVPGQKDLAPDWG